MDAILGFVAKTTEPSGGSFRMEVHDVVANDDHAVALFGARAEREGRSYENRNVLVIHIRNGKLVETWRLSQDQYAADEFFSQALVDLHSGEATASVGGLPSPSYGRNLWMSLWHEGAAYLPP